MADTQHSKTLRERAGRYALYGAVAGLAWGAGTSLYTALKIGMGPMNGLVLTFLGTGPAIVYGALAGALAALAVAGAKALARRAGRGA